MKRMNVRIAVVQTDPQFGRKEQNLDSAIDQMRSLKADVYVLPELFATGYSFSKRSEVEKLAEPFDGGQTTRSLQEFAREQTAFVIYGFAESDGSRVYNSAGLLGFDGTKGLYRKIHLFDRETLLFTPGNLPFAVWETPAGRIGMMICFDWYFPESVRTLALRGAQIIAHPSNLILPHCPEAMRIPCLENRVFAATANRVGREMRGGHSLTFIGQSQITSPTGEVLYRSPPDRADLGIFSINPRIGSSKSLNEYNDLLRDRRPEFYE